MTHNTSTQPLATIKTSALTDHTATIPLEETENHQTLPPFRVTRPLQIPSGVSSNVIQHVLMVRDCSSSMLGKKIKEVNLATTGLFQVLANEQNKDGFRVSLIDFSNSASCVAYAQSAKHIVAPQAIATGGTNFDNAITCILETVLKLQNAPNPDGWRYLRPQVLFLSDGQSKVSDKNIQDLQEIADMTTIAYGSDAHKATLSKLASDGECHVIGTSGSELRKFLADVGHTLSQSLASTR